MPDAARDGAAFPAAARGLALFLSLFTLLNIAGEIRHAGFDANDWWIDLRPLPPLVSRLGLVLCSAALLSFVVRPASSVVRIATALAAASLLMAALANTVGYYTLLARGAIDGFPLPLSLFIALSLALILLATRHRPLMRRRHWWITAAVLALSALAFPLLQMVCFGRTDYRRPADAAIVFGARAYADGTPSQALHDRVATACRLYQAGLVHKIIMSGGPGDGPIHETQAMRTLAMSLGVADKDILLDPAGLSTSKTVHHTSPLLDRHNLQTVLAVSDFYHLPRIKMTYQRAGRSVLTVPSEPQYTLTKLPYFMLREIAALWAYYLAPLL